MSYPGRTKELEGIVLTVQDAGQRDQIAAILCREGMETVYAKGTLSSASRNRRLVQPCCQVHLFLSDHGTGRMETLIHGDLLHAYRLPEEDLISRAILAFLTDLLMQTPAPEKLYDAFLLLLKMVEEGSGSSALVFCFFLKRLLKSNGIAPYTEGCISCGSTKGIETLSIQHGGFLCHTCSQGKFPAMEKKDLRKYRLLMAAKEENLPYLMDHTSWDLGDFLFLGRWFEQYSGIDLPSWQFVKSVLQL